MNRAYASCLVVVLSTLVEGCATPAALRRQTVHQGDTVADIHQQQVLDNLAKFIVDPYAVPSFAVAASGAANVDDQCSAGLGLDWMNVGFDSASLSLGGQRSQGTSWVTTPVTDPRKLELMRCAYQRVLTRCGYFPAESTSCPDCTKRFNQFYTGRAYAAEEQDDGTICYDCENGQLSSQVSPPVDDPCVCSDCNCPESKEVPLPSSCESCPSPGDGIVNSECLTCDHERWFCYSRNASRVPKDCGLVGYHCGVYVWVPCGPKRDEIAKLTLAILDYAVHDDAELPTKEVEAYLDCQLQPTTKDAAVYTVTTLVTLDESTRTVHMGDKITTYCSTEPNKGTKPSDGKATTLSDSPSGPTSRHRVPSARPFQRRSPMPGASIPRDQQLLNTL